MNPSWFTIQLQTCSWNLNFFRGLFNQTAQMAPYSALVWLFGGRGFPRWCAVVSPYGLEANSSFTSARSLNPAWKLSSKSSVGAKDSGFSFSSPCSLVFHASNKATLASAGVCAGLQKICGARTWKPQKRRTPFCTKQISLFSSVTRKSEFMSSLVSTPKHISPVKARVQHWCLHWGRLAGTWTPFLQ